VRVNRLLVQLAQYCPSVILATFCVEDNLRVLYCITAAQFAALCDGYVIGNSNVYIRCDCDNCFHYFSATVCFDFLSFSVVFYAKHPANLQSCSL